MYVKATFIHLMSLGWTLRLIEDLLKSESRYPGLGRMFALWGFYNVAGPHLGRPPVTTYIMDPPECLDWAKHC